MGTDFEDLVSDSLQRRAAAVTIPADLAGLPGRARRHLRRRRYVRGSGLTVATAAGLAVVIPLATSANPRKPGSAGAPATTVAYVVGHAERSIEASAATKVMVVRDRYRGAGTVLTPPNDRRVTAYFTVTWSHGDAQRVQAYSAAGRPLVDQAVVNPRSSRGSYPPGTTTGVDYVTRTWWRISGPGAHSIPVAPPDSCTFALGLPLGPVLWPGELPSVPQLRYLLRCGVLRLAGRQWVAGIDAIKIVSVPGAALSQVIWVDPATYLPVQGLMSTTTGTRWSVLASYRWLPATPRNLALLSPPVPAGFRHAKFTSAQRPVAVFIPLPK